MEFASHQLSGGVAEFGCATRHTARKIIKNRGRKRVGFDFLREAPPRFGRDTVSAQSYGQIYRIAIINLSKSIII
jgi:hypothetical protein